MVVSALYIYPIKSCRAMAVRSANVTPRGFEGDREFMLVDRHGNALHQREFQKLAAVEPVMSERRLSLKAPLMYDLSIRLVNQEKMEVSLYGEACSAFDQGDTAAAWFGLYIGRECRLVRLDPEHVRTKKGSEIGFQDAAALHVVSEGSVEDLEKRAEARIGVGCFRPNIVIRGALPLEEDFWERITVDCSPRALEFHAVSSTKRCATVGIDQANGEINALALQTLAGYRRETGATHFGIYCTPAGTGMIEVGSRVHVSVSTRHP